MAEEMTHQPTCSPCSVNTHPWLYLGYDTPAMEKTDSLEKEKKKASDRLIHKLIHSSIHLYFSHYTIL